MQKILVFIMIVCLFGCQKEDVSTLESVSVEAETEDVSAKIYVHVCGAVKNPGVYEFVSGSRIYEAIEEAGGFTEEAATSQVNQAQVLEDEMRLYIPSIDELTSQSTEENGKVNLNTASEEQLMTLPGIGEAKAKSIVTYREKHGGFKKIEDIMEISGIKEALFQKIEDLITV